MKILDLYTDYLISQNKYATSTGLSSLLEGSISHDKITRFLNREELSGKDLWLYIKPQIREVESEGGALILDDCIEGDCRNQMQTDKKNVIIIG